MPLSVLSFSDLILLPDWSAKLKGCPDMKQRFILIPEDCENEVQGLPNRLIDAALSKLKMDPAVSVGMRELRNRIADHGLRAT
jgi:twitching motility protein PilT